uniref:Uncharacterized protein n=1 Tax=Arundo donax TaxID=35708 RepID=A0A0A9EU53_ARUDO
MCLHYLEPISINLWLLCCAVLILLCKSMCEESNILFGKSD